MDIKTVMVDTRDWINLIKRGYRTLFVQPAMIDVFPVLFATMVKVQ